MSVVSFEIVKGDYTGACEVSEVAVSGAGIYASATLRNIMVIPTESVGEAVLSVMVDGYERTVKIPDFNVVQVKRYLYSLTITDKDLILSARLAWALWPCRNR